MRKGLAAFIAAFFLLGVAGKAQAVIGIPDDVPGSTLLFPFFKVQPTRTDTDNQDTLIVVTNTSASAAIVHFTIWTYNSVHVFNFTVRLTGHDVFSCSLYDLIVNPTGGCFNDGSTPAVRPAPAGVATTLKNNPLDPNLLVGYVTADVVSSETALFPGQDNYPFLYSNVLIGHEYLVNLPSGSSTGINATSLETIFPCFGHPADPLAIQFTVNTGGFYRTRCNDEHSGLGTVCAPQLTLTCSGITAPYGDLTERIDGPNGDFAQTGDAGGYNNGTANITPDSPLSLIIRYFSLSALNGRSEVWLWKDRNTTGAAANVNVAVYDEAENVHSITFSLPHEVNFARTADIITPGANGGWFRITFPCGQFGSCTYSYPGNNLATPPIQAVAYSLQFADSNGGTADATLRWDALFPAHRQYTNYVNVGQ
jgi:hypothetical protein